MPGKLPIDRVRESRDAPRIYDAHRERYTESQAALRDAGGDDPVAGARPADADDQEPDAELDRSDMTTGVGPSA